jgi:hypothetical protein
MLVAAHGKDSLAVGVPVRESLGKLNFVPGKKEFCKFMIVYGIGVWGISYP